MRYKNGLKSETEWRQFCVDKTLDEIAEHFKVTVGSAISRCSLLGIKIKRKSNVKYAGLNEFAKTHTISECAQKYKVSYTTMQSYLKSHGIKAKSCINPSGIERAVSKKSGLATDMIITLCDFYSLESIAKVFGYSQERIRQIKNDAD